MPNINYGVVIAMGCGDNCPLPDPKHLPLDDFRQIRDTIAAKVEDLINRLE